MTIMYNLFLDRCRKQTREPRVIEIDEGDIPNPESQSPEPWESITTEQVHAAVADLEGPFREVYELRLISNCSYDEIADKLTIPRSTVGTRLLRARQKLKNRLLDLAAA
jgi:RNA polymerase sigma-70 factor (ECF subfamily)